MPKATRKSCRRASSVTRQSSAVPNLHDGLSHLYSVSTPDAVTDIQPADSSQIHVPVRRRSQRLDRLAASSTSASALPAQSTTAGFTNNIPPVDAMPDSEPRDTQFSNYAHMTFNPSASTAMDSSRHSHGPQIDTDANNVMNSDNWRTIFVPPLQPTVNNVRFSDNEHIQSQTGIFQNSRATCSPVPSTSRQQLIAQLQSTLEQLQQEESATQQQESSTSQRTQGSQAYIIPQTSGILHVPNGNPLSPQLLGLDSLSQNNRQHEPIPVSELQLPPVASTQMSSQFVSAAVPLDGMVSPTVKQKIWAEEYVDLATLLPLNVESAKYTLSVGAPDSESPALQCVPKPSKQIVDINQWLSAFEIYMTVYVTKFPLRAAQLIKYQSVIRSFEREGADWAFYDRHFRSLKQYDTSLPWGGIHMELWTKAVHSTFPQSRATTTYSQQRHVPRGGLLFVQYPSGYCHRFHRGNGCLGPCKYSHSCFACNQDHSYAKHHGRNDSFRQPFPGKFGRRQPAGNTGKGGGIPASCPMGRSAADRHSGGTIHPELAKTVEHIMSHALSAGTQASYVKAWTLLQTFCQLNGLSSSIPLPTHIVCLFIGHLFHRGYNISSARTILSGINYFHKMQGQSEPSGSFYIKKLLTGYQKLRPSRDIRMPITAYMLSQLLKAVPHCTSNNYDSSLFQAMFSTAFYAFARIGELCTTSRQNHERVLALSDIQLLSNDILVTFRSFKHSTPGSRYTIKITRQPGIVFCPYLLLQQYLNLRGRAPGPLFVFGNNAAVPRRTFDSILHATLKFCQLDTNIYKSHSFRIGAATLAASRGFSDAQIRLMGRWRSDAFRKYIRPPPLT